MPIPRHIRYQELARLCGTIWREDATFETSGIYHIIGDSIMELVTPSSGEKTYYRMLNNRQVMLSDKEGTISQSLLAEHYILNKK